MKTHSHYWQKIPGIAMILFFLGLIGGIAFRLTPFLRPLGTSVVDLIWYIGAVSYTLFYFFRISIENHRREICQPDLLDRLQRNVLLPEDISALHNMMTSHCRSKVKYNYLAWFLISLLSLVGAILFI